MAISTLNPIQYVRLHALKKRLGDYGRIFLFFIHITLTSQSIQLTALIAQLICLSIISRSSSHRCVYTLLPPRTLCLGFFYIAHRLRHSFPLYDRAIVDFHRIVFVYSRSLFRDGRRHTEKYHFCFCRDSNLNLIRTISANQPLFSYEATHQDGCRYGVPISSR